MFKSLKLPLRLAKFESGVLVLQLIDNANNDSGLQQKIVDLIHRNGDWGFTTGPIPCWISFKSRDIQPG